MSTPSIEACKKGIVKHAVECEKTLELADFAATQGLSELSESLRNFAGYHSYHAFSWAESLSKTGYMS